MLRVDPRCEFVGSMTKEMENHKTYIHCGRTEIHRDQATVERFNCTLPDRLFGNQYAIEMLLPSGLQSTAWVKWLPDVVNTLNNEVISPIGKNQLSQSKRRLLPLNPLQNIPHLLG